VNLPNERRTSFSNRSHRGRTRDKSRCLLTGNTHETLVCFSLTVCQKLISYLSFHTASNQMSSVTIVWKTWRSLRTVVLRDVSKSEIFPFQSSVFLFIYHNSHQPSFSSIMFAPPETRSIAHNEATEIHTPITQASKTAFVLWQRPSELVVGGYESGTSRHSNKTRCSPLGCLFSIHDFYTYLQRNPNWKVPSIAPLFSENAFQTRQYPSVNTNWKFSNEPSRRRTRYVCSSSSL
jgi:hypothetical protein